MILYTVDSSNVRALGWNTDLGLAVQFHSQHCARKARGLRTPGPCDCAGGAFYTYLGVTREDYEALMKHERLSLGEYFIRRIVMARREDGSSKYRASYPGA